MLGVAFLLAGLSVGASGEIDPKAQEVISRARTSQATYTIHWRIRGSNAYSMPEYEWASTFQDGQKRRLENNRMRVVVDCAAFTGVQVYLSFGLGDYSRGPKIAERYCGVNEELPILAAEWLGQKQTEYGQADEIRVVNRDNSTVYLILAGGEIVRITRTPVGSNYITIAEPMLFERVVPDGNVFSTSSLSASKVPRQIQNRAARPE